jgi:predicted SnoaL-like aldol condensation-catalyzing enzyme
MAGRQLEENKRLVERFFKEAFYERNLDVLDEIVAEDYIQHNPDAGHGRVGVRELFEKLPRIDPPPGEIVNLIAEGDFVVRQSIRPGEGMLIDIIRIEKGMFAEHWDAYRPDPGTERLPGF